MPQKQAIAIIGSAFGDEGKGLLTDYFASKVENAIVVRFNGGAQAGHTVVTPEGKRHVFGHIGAGTFAGASTYLSKFFLLNPIIFLKEYRQLLQLGLTKDDIRIYVDSNASVTTPYDMIINQIVERHRENKRHGSCGIGINETVERSLKKDFFINQQSLHKNNRKNLHTLLVDIEKNWVYNRLTKLSIYKVTDNTEELYRQLKNTDLIERWFQDIDTYLKLVTVTEQNAFLTSYAHRPGALLFEGAQGLLLDQYHKWFPHVTRSSTGIENVAAISQEIGIEELNPYYLHRAYTTRHGAGPLPYELPKSPYPRIVDLTNKPHEFQGSLRFGIPDIDLISDTIAHDVKKAKGITVNLNIIITCLDQMPEKFAYVKNSDIFEGTEQEFLQILSKRIKRKQIYTQNFLTSHGPTRNDIE